MKSVSTVFLLLFLLSSCGQEEPKQKSIPKPVPVETVLQSFQNLIDESALSGAVLLYHPKTNHWHSNDFNWTSIPRLPASTYKIPHSIIALETATIENEETIIPWDGNERGQDIWEQDLSFRKAFQYSCVPCYQSIAREIGAEKMKSYLRKLDYGYMDVNENNIDQFWLQGKSRISQKEQVLFLERFYNKELLIEDRSYQIMKDIMLIEKNDEYSLSGKTAWAVQNEKNNAWFVGYVETKDDLYYFATNISSITNHNLDRFVKLRKEITMKALRLQGIISE